MITGSGKHIRNILVVCTGNSCRSIMAEAYLIKRAGEVSWDGAIRSAGTIAMDGVPPAADTLKTLKSENIISEGLSSSALTIGLTDWADLILVMEPMHKEDIMAIDAGSEEKIFYLAEFAEEIVSFIIPDPIGRSPEIYKQTFNIIKRSVEGLLKWLKK